MKDYTIAPLIATPTVVVLATKMRDSSTTILTDLPTARATPHLIPPTHLSLPTDEGRPHADHSPQLRLECLLSGRTFLALPECPFRGDLLRLTQLEEPAVLGFPLGFPLYSNINNNGDEEEYK